MDRFDIMLLDKNVLNSVNCFLKKASGGVLLYGSKGLGKHMLARRMAMSLLEIDKESDLALHPDFVEVVSCNQVVKMEDLDPIRDRIGVYAISAKKKVFIIDDANLMTPSAQNSLLRLLEDMNDRAVFILVCHAHILATIRSRCHLIEVFPSTSEQMTAYLKKKGPVEVLPLAIASGCIGKYYLYCDKKNFLLDIRNFFSVFPRNSVKEMLISFSMLKEKDKNNFFEKYEVEEVRVFMNLLFEILNEMLLYSIIPVGKLNFASFFDFEEAGKHFTSADIINCQNVVREHFIASEKKGAYTKNDFFDLIRHL